MRTSRIDRSRSAARVRGACLLAAASLAAAPAAEAEVVQICDKAGNCYVFHDVPPCEEWGLGEGTTCINIYALANLGGFDDPAGRGRVEVADAPGGAVLALLSDAPGAEAGRTRLLDLTAYSAKGPVGVRADVREEGPVLVLDLELSILDRSTLRVRETIVESIDVTSLAFGPPCPADINGDAKLNIRDFIAFQAMFRRSDPRADFDGDGAMSINDFISFRSAFVSGCR